MTYHVWVDSYGVVRNNRFGCAVPDGVRVFKTETLKDVYELMEIAALALAEQGKLQEKALNEKAAIITELEQDRKRLLREEERSAWLETILRYVMYKIALATIIYGTHRDRTLEMLSLVRDINFKMSIWSMDKSEMDDIPF